MTGTLIRKTLTWLLLTILSASMTVRAADSEPTKIILSHETTRITEPLNDDGTVNYLAALNDRYSEGVTAENNAAVLLVQIIGPEMFPKEIRDIALKRLGMASLPLDGQYFRRIDKQPIDSRYFREATKAPWNSREHPELARCLEINKKYLDLAVAASKRPRYYAPLLSKDDQPAVFNAMLPNLQSFRAIGGALTARAMLNVNLGNTDSACEDLLAVHRLARLIGQGPTLIERLVGMALESIACKGDNTLATSGRLSSTQAQMYLAQLQGLPILPGIAESIDKGERFSGLDAAMFCRREGFEALSGLVVGAKREKRTHVAQNKFDWNEVLGIVNSWYDRLVEAAGKETFRERQEAFERISADLKEITANFRRDQTLSPPKTTQEMGNLLIVLLIPSVERASAEHDLAIMRMRTSQVALALAGYKAEHGSYPEDLAKLCPKHFKTMPNNLFTGQPLDYRPTKNGYTLLCPGPYDNHIHNRIAGAQLDTTDPGSYAAHGPHVVL